MSFDALNDFLTIFGFIMMICGAIIFSFATYWNIEFLLLSKRQMYSWIKAFSAIVCGLATISYIFLIVEHIIGNPVDVSPYGLLIMRPLMILMGGAFASSARARLTSLKDGGNEKWTLRKFKV
jgi:uncharacterized membrane protein